MDHDGDGISTLMENRYFWSDPFDATDSGPRLHLAPFGGGAWQASWQTRKGLRYQLEFSPDLVTWLPSGSQVVGTGAVVTRGLDPGVARIFYRLSCPDASIIDGDNDSVSAPEEGVLGTSDATAISDPLSGLNDYFTGAALVLAAMAPPPPGGGQTIEVGTPGTGLAHTPIPEIPQAEALVKNGYFSAPAITDPENWDRFGAAGKWKPLSGSYLELQKGDGEHQPWWGQWCELDAHWQNPDRDDHSGPIAHGIEQTIPNVPTGRQLFLFFDYCRRYEGADSVKVTAHTGDPATGVTLLTHTAPGGGWERAMIPFHLPTPAEGILTRPLCLRFDIGDGLDSYGIYVDNIVLVPVEIQVRKPAEGKWFTTTELKIAKWEEAFNDQGFRDDFIGTSVASEEIDRFRIRINTQTLPAEYRSFYISTTGADDAEYDDDPTEVLLELHNNPYGPSDGFVSKATILVADTTDTKFKNENAQHDQTHIAALGSDVEFRVKESTGDLAATLPVKVKRTVNVNCILLWAGCAPRQQALDKLAESVKIARELLGQVGVKANFAITGESVNLPGVDLSDGLTLDSQQTPGVLEPEGAAVLAHYATANVDDVACLFVDGIVWAYGPAGYIEGRAIMDQSVDYGGKSLIFWKDDTAEKYAGAFFVSVEHATREVLAHELCHVLGLLHIGDENPPNGDSSPAATRNLMHASSNYTYLYQWDSKRLREFQQIRMWSSKFLN